MTMQVRYEITPIDHLEMLKVKFGVSAKLANVLFEIVGVCVGIFASYFFGGAWFVVTAIFAAFLVTQLTLPQVLHRKIYYRNRSLFEMRTITFTDEGLRSERANSTIEVKWSSFVKFKETKNLFLTYQSKDVIGIVPKRAFPSPEAVAQFRTLLSSKIPSSSGGM